MSVEVRIAGRPVGPGHAPLLVAACGVDHRGDPKVALELVRAAAEARANAVTFQHVRGPRLSTTLTPTPGTPAWSAPPRLEDAALAEVLAAANEAGLAPGLVATEDDVVARAASLGAVFLKVVSSEVPNLPLLRRFAASGLPLTMNTGACSLAEVAEALETLERHGAVGVVLLHTGPRIPSSPEEVDLAAMRRLREAFRVPVGYADRCAGPAGLAAASALGADALEKHLRLPGPPGAHGAIGLEPAAWREAARACRDARAMAGPPAYPPTPPARTTRRSVVAARPLRAGEVLDAAGLALRQPGTGFPPRALPFLVGRAVRRDLAEGEPLTPQDVGMEEYE